MTTSKSLSLNKNKLGLSKIPKSLSTTVIGNNTRPDEDTPRAEVDEEQEQEQEEEVEQMEIAEEEHANSQQSSARPEG